MKKIITALNENLRVVYRKAIDADNALDSLKASGKGKFQYIFEESSGFSTKSNRFTPYVEEIAGEVALISKADENELSKRLPIIVKKLELMLTTLHEFKQTL